MSFVFSNTIIASVLNIARLAISVNTVTVMALEIPSARKTASQVFSRSCHGFTLCRSTSSICAASAGALAEHPAAPSGLPARLPRRIVELVAIGASTGGPIVLHEILRGLPASFPAPIVVVQHMAHGFVQGLADWLTAACALRAEVASSGTRPQPGRVYLAPDDVHLRIAADGSLMCDRGDPVNGHRPAVSCLFESVAARLGRRAIGILLTGMGKDGAAQLKQMKEAGAITIAQDRDSSVVHGMPGEAIRCGGAMYVMSPRQIAAALPALVNRHGDKQ